MLNQGGDRAAISGPLIRSPSRWPGGPGSGEPPPQSDAGGSRSCSAADLGGPGPACAASWPCEQNATERSTRRATRRAARRRYRNRSSRAKRDGQDHPVHQSQFARNLLGRPPHRHQLTHPTHQQRASLKLDRPTPPACPCRTRCAYRVVTLANRVSLHLTRYRRRRPIELSGNYPTTQSPIPAPLNLVAFVHVQLAVGIFHRYRQLNSGVALQVRARPLIYGQRHYLCISFKPTACIYTIVMT